MSKVFTLDSLREEIEREYAPLRFQTAKDEYVLQSILRVGSDERKAVLASLEALEGQDEEKVDPDAVLESVKFVLKTVTADRKGEKLLKELGDDLLLAMKLLEGWAEATQPGEAKRSES